MTKDSKIFIAGHRGLVGSSILALLQAQGYHNLITKTRQELNLLDEGSVENFFATTKPEYVFLAAAKVGGIAANNTYRADFIYENLSIQNHIIFNAYKYGVKKLLFLGSSCIYPKNAKQPMSEDALLTSELEYTNENHIIFNAYKYGVKKLLFLGSSCIYPKNAKQPMSEDALLTSELEYTNEPYAIAKIAGIKMCESFALQYGCDFISVMPTNLYGNNDNFNLQTSHVLPALLRKIHLAKLLSLGELEQVEKDTGLQGGALQEFLQSYGITEKSVAIWGSGKPRRELLHVSDMAEACVFAMQNLSFKDCITNPNEIRNTHLNVGYGSDISIAELSQLIKEIVGFEGELVFDKSKPDGTYQKLMDSSRLNALGWSDISIAELSQLIKEIVGFEGELVFDKSKPDGTYQKLMDSSRLNALGWKPKIHLKDGIQSVYQHYLSKTLRKLNDKAND